jgi:hypothetical protein
MFPTRLGSNGSVTLSDALPFVFRNLTVLAFASSSLTTKVDFTVTGSMATLFASPGKTLTAGLPLPGLGTLYMSPSRGTFDIGQVRIDRAGIGKLSFSVPTHSLDDLVLVCQAVVETKAGTPVGIWKKTKVADKKYRLTFIKFGYVPASGCLKRTCNVKLGPADTLLVIIGTGTGAEHINWTF